jgi:hypothetical protein
MFAEHRVVPTERVERPALSRKVAGRREEVEGSLAMHHRFGVAGLAAEHPPDLPSQSDMLKCAAIGLGLGIAAGACVVATVGIYDRTVHSRAVEPSLHPGDRVPIRRRGLARVRLMGMDSRRRCFFSANDLVGVVVRADVTTTKGIRGRDMPKTSAFACEGVGTLLGDPHR